MKEEKNKEKEVDYVKILIYGDSGVGKTVLSSTAPNALLLDTEAGVLSIKEKIRKGEIQVKKIKKFDDFSDLVDSNFKDYPSIETVIIDSLSELQKLLMDSIIIKFPEIRRPYGDSSSQSDWGRNLEILRRYLRRLRNIEKHLVFTTLAQQIKDEQEGNLLVKPSLSGKIADEICALVDIVGYLFVVEDKKTDTVIRRLLVHKTGKYIAKDRTNKLKKIIDKPNLSDIMNLIMEVKK